MEKLQFILTNVNDWLKFAEAKNGAILVFAAALLGICIDKMNDTEGILHIYLIFFLAFNVLAFTISLCSFIPKLKSAQQLLGLRDAGNQNTLYFGDLSAMKPEQLLNALGFSQQVDKYESDLANQIIVNAQIALSKYEMFRIAIWVLLGAILTPVLALLLLVIVHRKN